MSNSLESKAIYEEIGQFAPLTDRHIVTRWLHDNMHSVPYTRLTKEQEQFVQATCDAIQLGGDTVYKIGNSWTRIFS